MTQQDQSQYEAEHKKTSAEIVHRSRKINAETGISFLLGHLRELYFSAILEEGVLDKVHRRSEAIQHTLPTLLKFGSSSAPPAKKEEVLALLDRMERLMDVNDILNQFEVLPESDTSAGVEVQLRGVLPEERHDFLTYCLRVNQHHYFENAHLEFPEPWGEMFKSKLSAFDEIFYRVLSFRTRDIIEILKLLGEAQASRLDKGGKLYESYKFKTRRGDHQFSWDAKTFAWNGADIRAIFGPSKEDVVRDFLDAFSFEAARFEAPFVRYATVQFAPVLKIGKEWYFGVDYILRFVVQMLEHSLEKWVKNGLATEKEVRSSAEASLIEEVSKMMKGAGYVELFRQKKFKPKKNDDVDIPTDIDLLFQSSDGAYLAVEVKGGGLSREMLYDLSFSGFVKERRRAFRRQRQLKNQEQILSSEFGKRKLKEYVADYDIDKEIQVMCVSRYPLVRTKSSEYNSISLNELDALLSAGMPLTASEALADRLSNHRQEQSTTPDHLRDILPESDFALLNNESEVEAASRRMGYVIWDCHDESFVGNMIAEKSTVLMFPKERQAAAFAKESRGDRTCRFMEIKINDPLYNLCKTAGWSLFLVDKFEGDQVSGLFIEDLV